SRCSFANREEKNSPRLRSKRRPRTNQPPSKLRTRRLRTANKRRLPKTSFLIRATPGSLPSLDFWDGGGSASDPAHAESENNCDNRTRLRVRRSPSAVDACRDGRGSRQYVARLARASRRGHRSNSPRSRRVESASCDPARPVG